MIENFLIWSVGPHWLVTLMAIGLFIGVMTLFSFAIFGDPWVFRDKGR